MRVRIAKQLIAGIGISAITLCGTTVIARADPPPDKKQHEKHAQAKPAQAKPAQAKPKAQPQAQRPAEQVRARRCGKRRRCAPDTPWQPRRPAE